MEDHMTISERLFRIMEEKNISMSDLSRLTGISRHTIFDWHKKNTNPGSDKIMGICRALEITPEQLLTGEGIDDVTEFEPVTDRTYVDRTEAKLLEDYHGMQEEQKKRLLAYVEALKKIESLEDLK
jgi:transcriptional regulator with XRE-family HTH domain